MVFDKRRILNGEVIGRLFRLSLRQNKRARWIGEIYHERHFLTSFSFCSIARSKICHFSLSASCFDSFTIALSVMTLLSIADYGSHFPFQEWGLLHELFSCVFVVSHYRLDDLQLFKAANMKLLVKKLIERMGESRNQGEEKNTSVMYLIFPLTT